MWVESGVFQWVLASYRGAGCFLVVLGGLHLIYTFFPFSVSTAQIIGEFWKNRVKQGKRRSANSIGAIYVADTAEIIGAAWHLALIGEAGNARRACR